MCCAVLCCAVLCCAVLCCVVLQTVANDVETEQIVHDRCGADPTLSDGSFTSFVQLRASIPLCWSQESNAMIAKPAIVGMCDVREGMQTAESAQFL